MKTLITTILVLGGFYFGNGNPNKIFALQKDNQEEKIFKKNCAACHTGGFKGWVTGAPEIGNPIDWQSSFEKNIQELTTTVYTGSNDHKLKGGCNDCTKEQIKAVIEYIKIKTVNH